MPRNQCVAEKYDRGEDSEELARRCNDRAGQGTKVTKMKKIVVEIVVKTAGKIVPSENRYKDARNNLRKGKRMKK